MKEKLRRFFVKSNYPVIDGLKIELAKLICRRIAEIGIFGGFLWLLCRLIKWLQSPVFLTKGYFLSVTITSYALLIYVLLLIRSQRSPYVQYRQDEFLRLVWRWNYCSYKQRVIDLKAYCPICDTELELREFENSYPSCCVSCSCCGIETQELESTRKVIEKQIERCIDRNLRTGDWRKYSSRIADIRSKFLPSAKAKVANAKR